MSPSRNIVFQRIGAASGIVAPIVAFTCIFSAIGSYPSFSWTNNALSDLGVVSGITNIIFNFGLLAAGLLAFSFAGLGLFHYLRQSWVGKIGSAFFAAAALALIAIGIFNEYYSPTHYLVSVAFFALAPIALLVLTAGFILCKMRAMAVFTFSVGLLAALPWILQFAFTYVQNVAIPETLSALLISIWTVVLSIRMLRVKA
jgi:hypothetical membrane protein